MFLLLVGCGGGGQKDTPAYASLLSGNWEFVLTQNPPSTAVKIESGFLVQSGNSLAGNVLLSGAALCPGLGSVQGHVNGSTVALTVTQIAQTVNLTGTVVGDGSSMSGNYSIYAQGCGGGSTDGTWTATPVKPLNGTYQAAFTSTWTSGLVYDYAVTVAQGSNTGSSTGVLAGSMTSTNAPCASNLSIAGLVGGTSVVFNLLSSDGSAVGQFRGSTSTDATTLTGTYDFLAQNNGCSGDAGMVTMTLR